MLPEWQAHIDELLERYRQKRDQLRDVQRTADAATATVTTEDEMITVTVGPRGRLVGLELNPRVYRRMSPSELAAAVLSAAGEASAQVDGQVRAALASLRPPASEPGQAGVGGPGPAAGTGGTGGTSGPHDRAGAAGRPGHSTQPVRPAQPAQSGNAGQSGQSGQSGQPGQGGPPGRPGQMDVGAEVDVAGMLPKRPDDLDAFRDRYGLRAEPGGS
jgi:DNA-binding protein YbaB